MRGTIIGLERDGLDYVLVVKRKDSTENGLMMSKGAIYKILTKKGNFIGKEIEYSRSSLNFLDDLKAA